MRQTIARRLLDRMFLSGEVIEVERMTARMRRIRIGGAALAGLTWTPGQHVRVLIGDGRGLLGGVLRTYSIWRHDPAWEAVDLIGHDHGGDSARSRSIWSRLSQCTTFQPIDQNASMAMVRPSLVRLSSLRSASMPMAEMRRAATIRESRAARVYAPDPTSRPAHPGRGSTPHPRKGFP